MTRPLLLALALAGCAPLPDTTHLQNRVEATYYPKKAEAEAARDSGEGLCIAPADDGTWAVYRCDSIETGGPR